MSQRSEVLPTVELLLRLALEIHSAITLGWPHTAKQATDAMPAAAAQLLDQLQPWVTTQPREIEDEQRHTLDATALDEMCARAKARRPEGIEQLLARQRDQQYPTNPIRQ